MFSDPASLRKARQMPVSGSPPPVSESQSEAKADFLPGIRRVVLLGDSITQSGQYIEYLEAYAVSRFPERRIEFLNLGLPGGKKKYLSAHVRRVISRKLCAWPRFQDGQLRPLTFDAHPMLEAEALPEPLPGSSVPQFDVEIRLILDPLAQLFIGLFDCHQVRADQISTTTNEEAEM